MSKFQVFKRFKSLNMFEPTQYPIVLHNTYDGERGEVIANAVAKQLRDDNQRGHKVWEDVSVVKVK